MRKNKMMRLASGLLVAVLLTTSTISGTFAKYVTSDSASDTARVAKWGITVLASGNLFGTDYSAKTATPGDTIIAVTTSDSVSSSNTNNIVAPGTKNDTGFTLSITGTPEVEYTITATDKAAEIEDIFLAAGTFGVMVKAEGLNVAETDVSAYFTKSGNSYTKATGSYAPGTVYYELHDMVTLTEAYYPINWEVTNTGNATAVNTTKNLNDIADKIEAGIVAGNHKANDNAAASYKLTWEWPFDSTVDSAANDGADTILGNLMAGNTEGVEVVMLTDVANTYTNQLKDGTNYNLEVKYAVEVSVTQVN